MFSDAAINSYVAIIMPQIAGAESLSVPGLPSSAEPPLMELRDDVTAASVADVLRMSSTTTGFVHQLIDTGYGSGASDQLESPTSMLEPRTTYIVGPLMYVYFSTVNALDAGFTVDLLFHHPDYLKVSLRFVTLSS